MVKIYCIEDINGNIYIGSTIKPLSHRLSGHKCDTCSSSRLDLYNSFIYTIEDCDEEHRKEREQYWIDNTDCVNINNVKSFDSKQWGIKYRKEHKENKSEWYKKNKERITKLRADYYMKNKDIKKDYDLFRSKKVCYGCYDFIMMLNEYN